MTTIKIAPNQYESHHGPASGSGRTKKAAERECWLEHLSMEDDAERGDREDGVSRDEYGFVILPGEAGF